MKWHPIEDGNLEELDTEKEYLFSFECTSYDGEGTHNAIGIGYIEDDFPNGIKMDGPCQYVKAKDCKAWMELPEPYDYNRDIQELLKVTHELLKTTQELLKTSQRLFKN